MIIPIIDLGAAAHEPTAPLTLLIWWSLYLGAAGNYGTGLFGLRESLGVCVKLAQDHHPDRYTINILTLTLA